MRGGIGRSLRKWCVNFAYWIQSLTGFDASATASLFPRTADRVGPYRSGFNIPDIPTGIAIRPMVRVAGRSEKMAVDRAKFWIVKF